MSNMYTSQYAKIVTDSKINSVNESLQKKLTIEEYYDLMHHTHKITDLIASGNSMSYAEMQETILNLSSKVHELTNIVNQLSVQLDNGLSVSDWDVTTPGIQDVNGNTLGDFMGFNMTEIE